jgi:hypothetical protein
MSELSLSASVTGFERSIGRRIRMSMPSESDLCGLCD